MRAALLGLIMVLNDHASAMKMSPLHLSRSTAVSAPLSPRLPHRHIVMEDSTPSVEDLNAKRAESGKAGAVSLIAGTIAATPFLCFGPGAFTSPTWELQADGLALMLLLFGVVYRYAVRADENPMLKQGVVGAFVITRSWALITPPTTCDVVPLNCGAPLGYFNWDMILQGSFATVETGAACAAAAFAIEACFEKGWIKRCTDGV